MQIIEQIIIPATQPQIWDIISDIVSLRDWIVIDSRVVPPKKLQVGTLGVGETFSMTVLKDIQATFEISAWEPGRSLAFDLVKLKNAPTQIEQYRHAFTLDLADRDYVNDLDQTLITWTVDYQVAKTMSWFDQWLDHRAARRDLEHFMSFSLYNIYLHFTEGYVPASERFEMGDNPDNADE